MVAVELAHKRGQFTASQTAGMLGRGGNVGLNKSSGEKPPGILAPTQQPHFCPPDYTHRRRVTSSDRCPSEPSAGTRPLLQKFRNPKMVSVTRKATRQVRSQKATCGPRAQAVLGGVESSLSTRHSAGIGSSDWSPGSASHWLGGLGA